MPTQDIANIIVDGIDVPKADIRLFLAELVAESAGVVTPQLYGAVGDGVADDTEAIQAAIDDAGSNTLIYFPAGTYKVTSTLRVSNNRVHMRGAGVHATMIKFQPTANDTCLEVSNGGNIVWQCSLSDLSFFSDDETHLKIAIHLIDTSEFKIRNVSISGSANGTSYWGGDGLSVGLLTQGREMLSVHGFECVAHRPIVFGKNPNFGTIDCDHFHFEDCYLIGGGNPLVTVLGDLAGMYITQMLFDGHQAWVSGTDGFHWVETAATGVSNGLTFKNVRREQVETTSSYFFRISHNAACQNVTFESCVGPGAQPPGLGGGAAKGVYLRKSSDVRLVGHYHTSATEALNIDGTVSRLVGLECFWQTGSTLVSSGQRQLFGTPKSPGGSALPPTFIFDLEANGSRDLTVGGGLGQEPITVANTGLAAIGPTGTAGILTVISSEGVSADFALKGTNNAVIEVSDPDNVFTASAGSASSTNVYWSAGNARYEIQNLRGGELRYRLLLRGSYSTF